MLKYFSIFFLCIFTTALVLAQPAKQAPLYFKRGVQLQEKGLLPDAIASFKKAIFLNKKYDSAYLALGMLYTKVNKVDSAIITLNNALQIKPGFVNAYIMLGNIYRDNLGKPDEAIINYLNAIKTDSNNKVTYYSLAWCYNAKENYREAIKYGVKALDIDNDYKPAYNELGHAYHLIKDTRKELINLKRTLLYQ